MEAAMLLKLVGAIGAAGILLTTLSAAPASATTNTVTIGSVTLTARVLVAVPVTVVCDPLGTVSDQLENQIIVSVTQASGRAVATGQGEVFSESPQPLLLTCDGVTQNHVVVDVLPAAGSPPFHGGSAIISASFTVFDFSTQVGESGNTGNTPVKIRG
jgi:hypothetical protein